MATVDIRNAELRISLRWTEKLAGLVGDQRVPLGDVTDVEVHDDPFTAIEGLRAPGLAIPGRTRIGTWRAGGQRTFVCARRSQPAVRVRTRDGGRFSTYVVSVDDAEDLADRLRAVVPGR
jgi:hypothetical protein